MKLKIIKFLDVAVEHAIYGLILFIPISIALVGVFAVIAVVLFLINKILTLDFSSFKKNKVLFIFLLLFFVFMGVSLFNSGVLFEKSLRALLLKWGRFPLLLWMIIDTFHKTKRQVKAVYVILLSSVLVGLSVLMQKFFGWEFLRGNALSGLSSPVTGPFKNQNALAVYLTCVIPIVCSLFLFNWKNFGKKLLFLVISTMLILSSYWAFCRGGWLGVAGGLFFTILFFNYYRLKTIFWKLFISFYFIVLPLFGFILYYFSIRKDSSRFVLFSGAWNMIKEHPFFGIGVGTFMDHIALYSHSNLSYYAHNCYLQIWAESGIFSLLFFILIIFFVLYKSIEVIVRGEKSFQYFALLGLTGGVFGFLIHSFFEVSLYSFQLSFIFWIMLSFIIVLTSNLNKNV